MTAFKRTSKYRRPLTKAQRRYANRQRRTMARVLSAQGDR
jgi:hypothetical protein